MPEEKDKKHRAVRKIEKAVQKAKNKGVTDSLIAKTVDKALSKSLAPKKRVAKNSVKPKKAAPAK